MTSEDDLDDVRAQVERRAGELQRLYVEMQELVRGQMDQQRAMGKAELKEVNIKLSEMQTLQLSLLRAEETLYDKLRFTSDAKRTDYTAIRREIGRSLNRLRQSLGSEGVSGGAVRSSD